MCIQSTLLLKLFSWPTGSVPWPTDLALEANKVCLCWALVLSAKGRPEKLFLFHSLLPFYNFLPFFSVSSIVMVMESLRLPYIHNDHKSPYNPTVMRISQIPKKQIWACLCSLGWCPAWKLQLRNLQWSPLTSWYDRLQSLKIWPVLQKFCPEYFHFCSLGFPSLPLFYSCHCVFFPSLFVFIPPLYFFFPPTLLPSFPPSLPLSFLYSLPIIPFSSHFSLLVSVFTLHGGYSPKTVKMG